MSIKHTALSHDPVAIYYPFGEKATLDTHSNYLMFA